MQLTPLILFVLALAFAFSATAQPKGKPQLKWRLQQLHQDNNEGIAVGDIDGNGWKDVIAPGKSGTYIIWNNGK